MDKAIGALMRILLVCALTLGSVLLPAPCSPARAAEPDGTDLNGTDMSASDRVVLNAARVSYNDETGQASAQGEAVLTYQGTTIRAERIDYDAATQRVEAMPLPGEQVELSHSGRFLRGDRLNYDLTTREGVLTGARTQLAAGEGTVFVHGGEIEVVPWETAVERGLVSGRRDSPEDYVAQWRDVTLTTCNQEHPHYRLESKRISFIPGRSVVAKRPRVYLGSTYLFTSPLDYVLRIDRRAVKYSLIPYIQRSSTRGTGGGVTGSLGWDTGSLSLGLAWADRVGFEGMLEVEQELGREFTITAGAAYSWDDVWDETIWRPHAALTYRRGGWRARLNWAQNEYIEDQKDSLYKYKGRLDRRPELTVWSPWFRASPYWWLTLSASWGAYREETLARRSGTISRYGLESHSYFEKELWPRIEFFSDTMGSLWFYDRGSADQQMLWSFTGLRYRIGAIELGTAYERRSTWGDGAMLWDLYRQRERVHQKLRFPMGREIYASFRGSYDLDESLVDEVIYSLQWVVDCMTWDLHYADDRTSGNDDRVGLSLFIRAFPDTPASFGQRVETDPFDRPRDLPKE